LISHRKSLNQFEHILLSDITSYFFSDSLEKAPAALPDEKVLTLDDIIKKEDAKSLYKNREKIGEGAAGEVFSATHKDKGTVVAIKQMNLAAQQKNLKLLITEIDIMRQSSHKNIVHYYDSYIVDDKIFMGCDGIHGGRMSHRHSGTI